MTQQETGKILFKIRMEINLSLEEYCKKIGVSVYEYLSYESGFFREFDEKFNFLIFKLDLLYGLNKNVKKYLGKIKAYAK